MSQCFNPNCLQQNPPGTKFCQQCGTKMLLGDRYRIMRYIGEGGFGRTFQAVDEHRLNTACVIKQFLPQHSGSVAIQKATELFKLEAVRLRDLGKHPQIPDLLAFFEQDGRLYLIQEFIDGKNLLEELIERGKFSELDVKKVLNSLLPVLDFIHSQQVIHRDIKPENIIRKSSPNPLTSNTEGEIVLIDFGVSKELNGSILTRLGTITGTPGYAPPEQMRGISYPNSDLYSLGVTCIRLLTKCLPKPDGSDPLFDSRKLRWKWREYISVSNSLGLFLDKLLQDLPDNRFQSAAEALQSLNSQSTSLPLSQLRNSQTTPSSPPGNSQIRLSSPPGNSQASRSISLPSDVNVDYKKLHFFLAKGKWKEADEETARMMIKVVSQGNRGWLEEEDMSKFPCTDLHTINKLWRYYSKNKFGFSIQKQLWTECGGQLNSDNWEVYEKFGDLVGWRQGNWLNYSDFNFTIDAKSGHLPATWLRWSVAGLGLEMDGETIFSALVLKLTTCKL